MTTVICLANSRKPHGKCVAGKVFAAGKSGNWIRPVSNRPGREVSDAELVYANGQSLKLLDIVAIPLVTPQPRGHQTENFVIAPNTRWVKQGRATWAQVEAATDNVKGPLLHHNEDSYHGTNDKVPGAIANTLPSSLVLIEPDRCALVVGAESKFTGGYERRVRAHFQYKRTPYVMVVTDPWIEERYFGGQDGTFQIADSRLCVSLAEIAGNIATKVVAAVITPDRVN